MRSSPRLKNAQQGTGDAEPVDGPAPRPSATPLPPAAAGAERSEAAEGLLRGEGDALPPRLYHDALDADGQQLWARAAACEGLSEELALLRVLVHRLVAERPIPWRTLLEALVLVVRAAGVEVRRGGGDGGAAGGPALDRLLDQLDALMDTEGSPGE